MANPSIVDFALFRNRQIQINEQMALCLWDLEALVTVALGTNDFFDLTKSTMHCYFSVVANLIKDMVELNQTSLVNMHEE